jgi:hypothetical protein
MEGWRQRRIGSKAQTIWEEKTKNHLDTNRPSHGRMAAEADRLKGTNHLGGKNEKPS